MVAIAVICFLVIAFLTLSGAHVFAHRLWIIHIDNLRASALRRGERTFSNSFLELEKKGPSCMFYLRGVFISLKINLMVIIFPSCLIAMLIRSIHSGSETGMMLSISLIILLTCGLFDMFDRARVGTRFATKAARQIFGDLFESASHEERERMRTFAERTLQIHGEITPESIHETMNLYRQIFGDTVK